MVSEHPEVLIRPRTPWRALAVADVWEYRHLLLMFGLRDVKLRYRQTYLGVAWVVLNPLLSAGILTVVFGYIAGIQSPAGVPYFAFAYLGQVGWLLFSATAARTSNAMVGNAGLVMKIYFPRPILPLSSLLAVLLDFTIAFLLAIPIIWFYAAGFPNIALTLGSGLLLMLLATGLGLLLAAGSVRFRDVLFVLPLLLQVGLYGSPVAYGLEVARDNLTRYSPLYFEIYMLNPLASLIEGFRLGLIGHGLVLPGYFVYSAIVSLLTFVLGLFVFRSAEGRFADVI